MELLNGPLYTWVILPMLIVLARIIDVSLGTLRIILVSRGMKHIAPVLGFFEILIWLLAIGQVFQHLDNPINAIAYALGFALGNYVGIVLEHRLAMGKVVVRVVTAKVAAPLVEDLRKDGFSVTKVNAEGANGPVNILYTAIRRSQLELVTAKILRFNPQAFYTVEDVRFVSGGIFSGSGSRLRHGQPDAARKVK